MILEVYHYYLFFFFFFLWYWEFNPYSELWVYKASLCRLSLIPSSLSHFIIPSAVINIPGFLYFTTLVSVIFVLNVFICAWVSVLVCACCGTMWKRSQMTIFEIQFSLTIWLLGKVLSFYQEGPLELRPSILATGIFTCWAIFLDLVSTLFWFYTLFLFMCMSVYLCVTCVYPPMLTKEGTGCLKAGVAGGCCELFIWVAGNQIWTWVHWKSTASILNC